MSRVAFSETAALPDTLDVIAYEMLFGNIPGGGNSKGLNLRSTDTNIPGISNESFTSTVHGHTRNFRGRPMFSGTWSTTFIETVDGFTLRTIRRWHERVAGVESGNSAGYLSQYSVTAKLIVYDTTGKKVNHYILEEVYPQDLPDVQLSGEASAAMKVPVTWKYARCIPADASAQ